MLLKVTDSQFREYAIRLSHTIDATTNLHKLNKLYYSVNHLVNQATSSTRLAVALALSNQFNTRSKELYEGDSK